MANLVEQLVGAADKAIDALQSGNQGKFEEAVGSALLAANAVFGLLQNSRLSGYVGIGSSLYDLKKAANDLYDAGDLVGSLRAFSDAMVAAGSLLATVPTP